MNDKLGQITSSPGPMPAACITRCNAVVHDVTATACGAPTYAANAVSNSATRGPCVSQPDRSTAATADSSSAPTNGFATGMVFCSLIVAPPSSRTLPIATTGLICADLDTVLPHPREIPSDAFLDVDLRAVPEQPFGLCRRRAVPP